MNPPLLRQIFHLNRQEFARIEPIIREAMNTGVQDLDYLERIKRYRREYRQVLGYLGNVAWEWDESEIK